jgi:hypothetical protein
MYSADTLPAKDVCNGSLNYKHELTSTYEMQTTSDQPAKTFISNVQLTMQTNNYAESNILSVHICWRMQFLFLARSDPSKFTSTVCSAAKRIAGLDILMCECQIVIMPDPVVKESAFCADSPQKCQPQHQ